MSASTTTLTAVTELVQVRLVAVPLDQLTGQPSQQLVFHLINQLADLSSHLSSSKWGGCHGFLPIFLTQEKMRLVANDSTLDCARIKTLTLINPAIKDTTKGRKLLQM